MSAYDLKKSTGSGIVTDWAVLPSDADGDWSWHPVLLGGSHGHAGNRTHRTATVQGDVTVQLMLYSLGVHS